MSEEMNNEELSNEKILKDYGESSEVYSAIKSYLDQIGNIPLLSEEEEKKLAIKVEQGDKNARKKMIESNLRLVVWYVKQNNKITTSMEFLDLVQEGNVGLIKAVEKYDITKGVRFSNYAIWWIRQAISSAKANQDKTIRIPTHLIADYNRYFSFKNAYLKKYGVEPTEEEILKQLVITHKKYLQLLDIARNYKVQSLNASISIDDKTSELENFIPYEEKGYDELETDINTKLILFSIKKELTNLEYYIIYYHYFNIEKYTLQDLENEMSISRQRVQQIEKKALSKVKKILENKNSLEKIDIRSILNHNFRPTPINQVILLIYLKNELDEYQYYIFYELYLKKITLEKFASNLKISINEVKDNYESLLIKYNSLLNYNSLEFNKVKLEILSNKRIADIFEINITPIYNQLEKIEKIVNNIPIEVAYNMLGENFNFLSTNQKNLFHSYFDRTIKPIYPSSIEKVIRKINLEILGYHKNSHLSLEKLHKVFEENRGNFSKKDCECLERTLFKTIYHKSGTLKGDDRKHYSYLIHRLETLYYNLDYYFKYEISKDEIEKILNHPRCEIPKEAIQLLKLRYGIDCREHSIKELAIMYQRDYVDMHDYLRIYYDNVVNQFLGITNRINISDETKYLPFLNNPKYQMTEETRNVCKLYLIEHNSYQEICQKLNIANTTRVSNIITDAIRKMEFWYYGMFDTLILEEEKVYHLLDVLYDNKDNQTRGVIINRFIYGLLPDVSAKQYNLSKIKVNSIVGTFQKKYISYYTKKEITKEEVIEELNRHVSDSILSKIEKKILSLSYGMKNQYNPLGIRYDNQQIMEMENISIKYLEKIFVDSKIKIGARINGIITPEFGDFTQEEIKELLKDRHIPISDTEKELLKYIKGIYEYKDIKELSSMFQMSPASVKRRIRRAMLNLKKYCNHELEKKLDYELDIKPVLKYFPLFEQNILYKRYKLNETMEQIGKTYHFTKNYSMNFFKNIEKKLMYILKCPYAKKFDFNYAREVLQNDNLPYYGNKEVALKVYNMIFGDDGNVPKSKTKTIQELGLRENLDTATIIKKLMIAVLKYKDGISKNKNVAYEEVFKFYQLYKDNYCATDQKKFEITLKHLENDDIINQTTEYRNDFVIFEILKSRGEMVFNKNISLDTALKILRDNPYHLTKSQLEIFRNYFKIPKRNLMSGRDKLKLLKLVRPYVIQYVAKLKQQETNSLGLQKVRERKKIIKK